MIIAMTKISHWKMKLLLTAAFGGLVLLMWRLHIPCLWLSLFHVPCMGCGMTRAWVSVAKLQFGRAFSYHPMFWSVPIAYLYILYDGRLFRNRWLNLTVLLLIGAGFLIAYIIRIIEFLG